MRNYILWETHTQFKLYLKSGIYLSWICLFLFVWTFNHVFAECLCVFGSLVAVHVSITEQSPAIKLFFDISVWWAELHSELSNVGEKRPLSGAVTGVNPKLSHQHPHGSLSLKCSRKHMSCSLGENGKWTPEMGGEVGGEVERQAGCNRGGCLLWALISLLGVWRSTEDDSTGNFFLFISFALFLVNLFSKNVSYCLVDSDNKAICSSGTAVFKFFHSFSHCCVVMTYCVMVIKPGCGWWGGYQQSQLESTQLLGWLL